MEVWDVRTKERTKERTNQCLKIKTPGVGRPLLGPAKFILQNMNLEVRLANRRYLNHNEPASLYCVKIWCP